MRSIYISLSLSLSSLFSLSITQDHSYGSRDLNAAIADAVLSETRWAVSLDEPRIELLVVVQGTKWSCGLLLPPPFGNLRRTDAMPKEVRPWVEPGCTRAHMRPSRAHLLLMALGIDDFAGGVLLDPCGGIGTLAIEAASMVDLKALSLDNDPDVQEPARAAVAAAAGAGLLQGEVEVLLGSAYETGLEAGSVDAVLCDLPWGLKHKKLDVGRLLREMARVVRVGGTVGLVVADWGGMFRKMERAIQSNPHRPTTGGAWDVVARVHHNASGMNCMAYFFRLRPLAEADTGDGADDLTSTNALGPMLSGANYCPRSEPPSGWGAMLGCCDAR